MFNASYFASRYYAPRYFPKVGGIPADLRGALRGGASPVGGMRAGAGPAPNGRFRGGAGEPVGGTMRGGSST